MVSHATTISSDPETLRLLLRARLAEVERRIEASAERAGRRPGDVTLIAVSKTHPPAVLERALEAGARDLGENRVQEAEGKIKEMGRARSRWHLIGPLQANKARRAIAVFDFIHTLDSVELATRLDRLCGEVGRAELPVLIQVSLVGEASKSGVSEEALFELAATVEACAHLRLKGLMTIPPFYDDPEQTRPLFRRLRGLRDQLAAGGKFGSSGPGELSMGMSHDYEVAIEEGATMIRVGTAIFGHRTVQAAPET